MLRIVFAIAIGLFAASDPAAAQIKSCQDFCAQNRCAHGAMNQTECMRQCVAFCKKKNPNG